MANYYVQPTGTTLSDFANARRNAGLSFNPAWLTDRTRVGTTRVVSQVVQPQDAGIANAIKHAGL